MRPESVLRPSYSDQRGRSGTRSTPKRPPFDTTRAIEARAALKSLGRTSDCRMPYGAITNRNWLSGNGSALMSPRTCQHRHGSIDADEVNAVLGDGHENPARPAAQFEHRSASRRGQLLPEPD